MTKPPSEFIEWKSLSPWSSCSAVEHCWASNDRFRVICESNIGLSAFKRKSMSLSASSDDDHPP
jgi:hypothetical protein